MKILTLVFGWMFLSGNAQAQNFEILNPKVEQGGVVIVKTAPQWQGSIHCISALGKHYQPDNSGYVFVGVPVDTKSDKYLASLVECGRGVRLNPADKEIEVTEKIFPSTKIGRKITAVNSKKRDRESKEIGAAYERGNEYADYKNGVFIAPLDPIFVTDEFGRRRIYLNGETRHGGIDLRAASRTPIKAINSGVVLLTAKNFSLEGNMVIIDHGSGIFSLYLHLSRINVKQGAKIKNGEVIGLSGSSGSATGPHLHFMVKINRINVDPLMFIDIVNQYTRQTP